MTLDTSKIIFSATVVNTRGAKTIPAINQDGSNVTWKFQNPLEVTFEPSAYNDVENTASRVTMCLTPTDAVCEEIEALDEWVLQTLSANPVSLLGAQLSPEQIRDRYVSSLKRSDKGYKTLRLKMNRSGKYALQCFTPDRVKRPHPQTWKGGSVQAQLSFRGLYLMGKDYGAIIEITHAIVHEPNEVEEACPF